MQGLVATYGGVVERVRPAHGEVASVHHDDMGVFAGVPSPYPAVRYHSLAATHVRDELVVTATCQDGDQRPTVMSIRHRTLPVHGVQFHPESVLSQHGARLVRNFLSGAP